jgi:hypothetical protein
MRTIHVAALAFLSFGLTGCPDDSLSNPTKVWLNDDGSETKVKLQDTEPRPY